MTRGRTISIYLPDGNARGVKICDIKDSIVKAFYIPRAKIQDIYKRDDLSEPGIYFLFSEPDEIGQFTLYIGEAENIVTRLKQHNANKDFWNICVCFVSEKKNLNKAHIKFLENYCCDEAKKINKVVLDNSSTPTKSHLTDQDKDFILSFFDDLKLILSTLGYPIFEESRKDKKNLWFCKGKDAKATGEYSEEGLTVFKGSKANLTETPTAGTWIIGTRDKLKNKGILVKEGNVLIFKEDFTFSSLSTAAAVVLARRANGWTEWKDKNGKTIDEKFRKIK
jgi:hypothetical protein